MSDASKAIAQQFAQAGVVPEDLTPVGGVSKTYVDTQDQSLYADIQSVAGAAASAQQTANSAQSAAQAAQQTANTAKASAEQANNDLYAFKRGDELDIKNGSIVNRHLRDDSVTTGKLAQKSVTLAKASDEMLDASNHRYSGAVNADDVQDAIDKVYGRVEYIIAESGDSVAELVDARIPEEGVPFPTLGTRLNRSDERIDEMKFISLADLIFDIQADGSDEGVKLKTAIEYAAENKLTLYMPKDMEILVDTVTVNSKGNIDLLFEGTIKRLDAAPTTGGMLRFNNCTNLRVREVHLDGNALNNGCVENTPYTVAQEQKHCLVVWGGSNVTLNDVRVQNPCGDGIYLGGGVKDVTIGYLYGSATQRIGRNILSIINAQNVDVYSVVSEGIGHYTMPGGIDIEPNNSAEIVRGIRIQHATLISGGTNILSVLNTNNAIVDDVYIGHAYVFSKNSLATTPNCVILAGTNVILNSVVLDGDGKANLLVLDNYSVARNSSNIEVKAAQGKNGYRGLQIGFNGRVENSFVNLIARNLNFDGVALFNSLSATLVIDIDSVKSDRFVVNIAPPATGGTVDKTKISGDISKRGTGLKAVIATVNPALLKVSNLSLVDLDFTGWGNDERLFGPGLQTSVIKKNCKNLTSLSAKPNFEQWRIGDRIENLTPTELGAAGTKYVVNGWVATQNGAGSAIWLDQRNLTGV